MLGLGLGLRSEVPCPAGLTLLLRKSTQRSKGKQPAREHRRLSGHAPSAASGASPNLLQDCVCVFPFKLPLSKCSFSLLWHFFLPMEKVKAPGLARDGGSGQCCPCAAPSGVGPKCCPSGAKRGVLCLELQD